MEDVIRLPEPERAGGLPIWTVIAKRRTVRKYRPMPLDLSTVSQLLWACAGISGERAAFRTSPSAGARHPAATLLVANNVTGLNPGIYRYDPVAHGLLRVAEGSYGARLRGACLDQEMLEAAPAVFAWNVTPERTTGRYGERGKRYIPMDLGHICQNLYLAATALGLGCCAVGAFSDAQVNSVFGVDGVNEAILYMATVGFPVDARSQ